MQSIVIFASGAGTNAAAIIDHFKKSDSATVSLIVCNKPDAGVLKIAVKEHIPYLLVDKQTFGEALMLEQLRDADPAIIVLAGFLWKIPENIVRAFHDRIINIHPALLPLHGGKGMYGAKVHQAVLAAGDKTSGITIHQVNEVYDEGGIIVQAHCPVLSEDTIDTLAARIHVLEHFYYPRAIEQLLQAKP